MLENQMREIGESAKKASYVLAGISTEVKNQALQAMARALEERGRDDYRCQPAGYG